MPRTLRILHVLHAFSAGGLENGIVNIINRSPDHLAHELCLLTRSGEFARRLNRQVVCHELNRKSGNDVRLIFRLRELFRKRRIDIVHTRNWAAFDGVLAACLTPGITLVHGEHGRDISDPEGAVRHRNFARRALAFRARKYVAVSQDLYRWLERTVHIPRRKLAFIPNGVDTDRFCPGRDLNLRAELGIDEKEFVVGAIGRLDPVKNHEGLVRAVKILSDSRHSVRLVIVGEGPNRQRLEEVIRASQLQPEPLLLGYRPEVERLYRVFDTFVLNSFAEGMSNTLLEAMASGLPIICTTVGGNPELVAGTERGVLIESNSDGALADAIAGYLKSPELRRTHGAQARDYSVQNFSISSMINRYVSLYESVA
jgi:sugar transferase (PEP-CTERM/EpsH1 system associated)